MLNRYPLWKYIMLVGILCVALLYALPNIFGDDPAIQISGVRGNKATVATLDLVKSTLAKQGIEPKSISFGDADSGQKADSVLVRLQSEDQQEPAKNALVNALGEQFVIAPNMIANTPRWLSAIGAEPMKKGLDLRGGVHFLMEVDMATALDKLQIQSISNLRDDFKAQKLPYSAINEAADHQIVIKVTPEQRAAIMSRLSQLPDFTIVSQSDTRIVLRISDARLQQAKTDAVQQNTTILRNRVNQLGVAEPVVQRQGAERIVVELPGIQDITQAKQILGATATLEFRLVDEADRDKLAGIVAGEISAPYGTEVKYMRDGTPVLLYKSVALTGDHITNSNAELDQYGQTRVNISLDSAGGKTMFNLTRRSRGKFMATLFVEYKDSGRKDAEGKAILEKHEEVINVARINDVFSDRFQITGISSMAEAKQLSMLLRAGALIAPIHIVEERVVGPSMGKDNIRKGLESCAGGLIISILFMLAFYRLFGLFASFALVANLILIVAIMSLLPGATLSMPGIAGIVLTVGMAVDANVLINERIKEELKNGRSPQHAINEGYAGAWNSIFDANITTLITAIILYAVGTGSIKGFAITLAIGVLTSMFTSIVGTRALANLVYGGRRVKKLSI